MKRNLTLSNELQPIPEYSPGQHSKANSVLAASPYQQSSFGRLLLRTHDYHSRPKTRKPTERPSLHKFQELQKKLQVSAPKKYYDNLPIKPGFFFFDSLLKAPRSHISSLEINIPESLYSTDKVYYLNTGPSGFIQVSTDIYAYKFMQMLEAHRVYGIEHELSAFDRVAAVIRVMDEEVHNMKKFVMDWNQFKVKMIGKENLAWSLIQKYIKCPGNRPSVTRLYFYPFSKQNRSNFAYFINSTASADKNLQRCVVDIDIPEALEMYKIAGKPLRPFEIEAQKIVDFLNKGYNLRIEEIILDFIRDETDKLWLSGCKGFVVDPSTLHGALDPVDSFWPEIHLKSTKLKKPNTEKSACLTSFVHCKLCRLSYPNKDLSHLVSVRMVLVYNRHVVSRKRLSWDRSLINIQTNDMLSQSVRVCQYCYMMITEEFELINAERELANLLNIPLKNPESEADPKLLTQLQFLPKMLSQWRALVIANHLFDYSLLPKSDCLYLHFKFDNIVNSYPITMIEETLHCEACIPLNMARVYYIYSHPAKSIKSFFKSFEFEVFITEGEVYNKWVVCRSSVNLFSQFTRKFQAGEAIYETKVITLSNFKECPVAVLGLTVGISHDVDLKREKIGSLLGKYTDVYIAQGKCMKIDPLPYQWMECFTDFKISHNSFEEDINEDNFYSPLITDAEIKTKEPAKAKHSRINTQKIDLHSKTKNLTKSKTVKRLAIKRKFSGKSINSTNYTPSSLTPKSSTKARMDKNLTEIVKYVTLKPGTDQLEF